MPFHKKLFKKAKDLLDDAIDFITDTVKAAIDIVASPFAMPDMGIGDGTGGQVNQQILGPLLNKDSGVGNIPVIYGQRRVGGYRVFVSTNGTDNEYLYVALAICEGQVQGIDKIYIDDEEVAVSSYAHGVQGSPSSGPYKDRLITQFFDGRDNQTVSSLLDAAPGWGSNHRLRGVAYLACRFRWKKIENQEDADNNPYRSGIPKIQVRIKGRKIFNVLTGYTQNFAGTITNANNGGPTGTTLTVGNTSNYASGTNVTRPPQGPGEGYLGSVYVTTTEANAVLKINLVHTASARDNTPGDLLTVVSHYAVYRTDVSPTQEIINSNTDGRPYNSATTTDSTPATVYLNEDVVLPSIGTYQVMFNSSVGPSDWLIAQGPNPCGSISWSAELPTTSTLTHTTTYDNETEVYNNNPVNVLIDYLRNPTYGKGLSNDYFDWDSIQLAAQQCDQIVPYTTSTTGKFSVFDGVLETSESLLNNVRSILSSFNGMMPYQAGRYFLKLHHGGNLADIDAAPNPPPVVQIINEDNLIGGLKIQGESKKGKINQLRVTYTDPDADYQPNDVFWPDSGSSVYSTYLTEDNSIPLDKQVAMPHCTNRERALNIAETLVKTSRNKMVVQFSTTSAVTNVSVGDLVSIQNKNLNFSGIFRIESMNLNASGDLGFVATEHNPNDYVLDGHAAAAAKPTINLPNPLLVSAPTNLAITQSTALSGSGYTADEQLDITWTASTDPFTTEYIVQVKRAADSTFYTIGITNDTEFLWGPVSSGDQWDVRVASRNELDRRSDYATVATYTVT